MGGIESTWTGPALFARVALVGAGWLVGRRRSKRRQRLRNTPMTRAWSACFDANVARYPNMPAVLRDELRGRVSEFVANKQFVGCNGLQITDEIRLTVASNACLLLLNRNVPTFSNVLTMLIYPTEFIAEFEAEDDWLHHKMVEIRSGESWERGPLVLAWDEIQADVASGDERNVVIHEFAHKLDEQNPDGDGLPILGDSRLQADWSRIMRAEFDALRAAAGRGETTLLDPYGAESPAEFFAVVTETFFGAAAALKARHPELYGAMRDCFRVEPANWQKLN